MTDLESPSPFDEGDHFQYPVLPVTQRNTRCHKVVGERELVIEKMEKGAKKRAQSLWVLIKNKGLT
jgi:hypothetical protein